MRELHAVVERTQLVDVWLEVDDDLQLPLQVADRTENRAREWWMPRPGDLVWLNRPDGGLLGRCVGYTDEMDYREDEPRYGQPVLLETFQGRPSLCVTHPMFCLPFPYGSKQWQQANREGRVRG